VETVQSIARANAITLTDEDRAQLDERFPAGRMLRRSPRLATPTVAASDVDIVLIMGLPGAGKSTLAATFVAQGYTRLNRDESGGTLAGLLPALERAIAAGSSRIVLDNTYVSRQSRARVIEAARQRGLPVRCLWLATSVEEAQVNAVTRLLARHEALDTKSFRPNVQFRYQRELEPPDAAEGFTRIDVVPFERRHDPSFTNRALIVWGDDVLWRSRSGQRALTSADDLEAIADRGAVLRRYRDEGWIVLGMSWRPEIADGVLTADAIRAAFTRLQLDLGIPIEIECCPHAAGPPTCWCRKPLPGLAVQFTHRHRLDAAQCLYVGAGAQDPGYARRLGFQYLDAASFFACG
jgi:predicted kinase/histidinol phosphatase-like enzyme